MNLHQEFERWLAGFHPEADTTRKGEIYANSTTHLRWVGFRGCYQHFRRLKEERAPVAHIERDHTSGDHL